MNYDVIKKNLLPKRRATVGAAAALVVLIIIISGRSEDVPMVECAPARVGDLTESIPTSGKIRPVTEVKISPDVSGEIVELRCKEGDSVLRGDTLILIKQDLYRSRLERAEAALASLRAQHCRYEAELSKASLDFGRSKKLLEQQAISQAEYDASETSYNIALQAVKASKFTIQSGAAELREARESLAKTTICAPMSGTVSRLGVELGERVVGTSQMAGTEMLRIADLTNMELVVEIGENDVVRIKPRDSVAIDIDAYPHRVFSGFVSKIANSAQNIDASFEKLTNFEVRIAIDSCDATLLPGMSASASIVTESRADCILIPPGSVFAQGKREFVWVVLDDCTVEKREIETGIQSLASIEALRGLSDGERIVTGPLSAISKDLSDGQKVKCKD